MNASELVKQFGDCCVIKVSGGGYDPSLFIKTYDVIQAYNKNFGMFKHEKFTRDKKAFENHLQVMIDEGLKVELV